MDYHKENERLFVVAYSRVSTKEQEREGFSIPAQEDLLRGYGHQQGMVIRKEFVDVESASSSGRPGFEEMIAFLKKPQNGCRTILVEKTDRLYRNIRDYSRVDELGVTIHFVKEGSILSPNSRSSEQLVHGIKVLMARNYSQKLAEETKKGQVQKAKSGLYPSFAPAGYRNVQSEDGKRIIVPSGDAPTITRLFEEFATGRYSTKSLAMKAKAEGWTIGGRHLYKSTLHLILTRRIYCGDFDWEGQTYKGTHAPLIDRETWEAVQTVLRRRNITKHHRIRHDVAFTGFVRCGHCGCAMVGELKKGRYIYYHCSGYLGKCREPYTREERMEDQLAVSLRALVLPKEVLSWLRDEVSQSDLNESAARDRELKRFEEQHRRLDTKIDAMYDDKLEGVITADMYNRKVAEFRSRSLELLRRMNEIRVSEPAPLLDCIDMMDLTSRAADLFRVQPPQEKQLFLRLVMKSASWRDGQLQTEFEEPFQSLRHSNQLSKRKKGEKECQLLILKFGSPAWIRTTNLTRF
jgi:DNA invertase Pin-like site-specific DNA recombinase